MPYRIIHVDIKWWYEYSFDAINLYFVNSFIKYNKFLAASSEIWNFKQK